MDHHGQEGRINGGEKEEAAPAGLQHVGLEMEEGTPFLPPPTPRKNGKFSGVARTVAKAVIVGCVFAMALPVVLMLQNRTDYWARYTEGCQEDIIVTSKGVHNGLSSSAPTSSGDELRGGLLVRGFGDKSCLSRYRYGLFRNLSGMPSNHLLRRLRQHEELQRQCGPNSDAYKEAVERLKSGRSSGFDGSGCKYLALTSDMGLGNRMLAAASTFLYAVLTNRTLLIDRWYDFDSLFCEPILGTSWLLPLDFPVQFRNFGIKTRQSYGNLLRTGGFVGEAGNLSWPEQKPPPYVFAHLEGDAQLHDLLFFCDDAQAVLNDAQWLLVKTSLYMAPGLFMIPAFEAELNRMFPRRDLTFHHLAHYLFHPRNAVWCLITKHYNSHLSDARERLGMQMRTFHSHQAKPILDQVLGCTRKENLLPAPATGGVDGSSITQKAVLITSLNSWYYDHIKKIYAGEKNNNITFFQPSQEGKQKFNNVRHSVVALSEIYLLSMADELVTTGQSTFGYVAAGLSGRRAWIMKMFNGDAAPDPPCRRTVTIEPCFHKPPHYECRTRNDVDSGSMVPFIKKCEDISWGVKIVY